MQLDDRAMEPFPKPLIVARPVGSPVGKPASQSATKPTDQKPAKGEPAK
jgi:hypothetical protein